MTMKTKTSTILVIEDDVSTLTYINGILSDEYDLIMSINGHDAMAQLWQKPDLVIVDNGLPDIKGVELVKKIQSEPDFASTPIFLMTADFNTDLVEAAFSAGVSDFIHKPCSTVILQARIRTHLELQHRRQLCEKLAS